MAKNANTYSTEIHNKFNMRLQKLLPISFKYVL